MYRIILIDDDDNLVAHLGTTMYLDIAQEHTDALADILDHLGSSYRVKFEGIPTRGQV